MRGYRRFYTRKTLLRNESMALLIKGGFRARIKEEQSVEKAEGGK